MVSPLGFILEFIQSMADYERMSDIPNILAQRYATGPMRDIWSATGKIVLEREFWIAVMKAQKDLGLDIPSEAIEAYEKVKDQVDLDSIMKREAITKHDVKARIEEFCDLAGHEHIHKGMTSRDLTENVEQLQILRSLEYMMPRAIAVLQGFSKVANNYRDLVITARTHNVAAQPTTFGYPAERHFLASCPDEGASINACNPCSVVGYLPLSSL